MTTLLKDDFETKLGTIQTWVESDSNGKIQQQDKFMLTTTGHNIYLQSFNLKQVWSPEEMQYESGKVWRWFIKKTNNEKEQLRMFCRLITPAKDIEWGNDSGEHLDAIEIENKTHQLHIGTEDGERMQYRAEVSNWMPERLKTETSIYKSFTEYVDFGFKTTVPILKEGERIYFHFIVATNEIKPSKDHPNERDISTWFAVDQSKKYLDAKLKSTAGNISFMQ
jgi:hypothetical protein